MKRIIDKQTKIFIRDDFTFDEETEIGLDVEPAQGLYLPKWGGEKWVEAGEPLEIEPQPQPPSEADRLDAIESALLTILMMGG